MTWSELEAQIADRATFVVDTSVVLAYLDGTERVSELASGVFDRRVRSSRNVAVISAIAVSEALVRPIRAGAAGATAIVETFLQQFPNVSIAEVTYDVAREAAAIRAATSLRTPDALILATAVVGGHPIVIANDGRWEPAITQATLPIRLLHLDAFV